MWDVVIQKIFIFRKVWSLRLDSADPAAKGDMEGSPSFLRV